MKYYQKNIGQGDSNWYGASPDSEDELVGTEEIPRTSALRVDNRSDQKQATIIKHGIERRNRDANNAHFRGSSEAADITLKGIVTKHDYMMETAIPEYLR